MRCRVQWDQLLYMNLQRPPSPQAAKKISDLCILKGHEFFQDVWQTDLQVQAWFSDLKPKQYSFQFVYFQGSLLPWQRASNCEQTQRLMWLCHILQGQSDDGLLGNASRWMHDLRKELSIVPAKVVTAATLSETYKAVSERRVRGTVDNFIFLDVTYIVDCVP